MDMAKAKTKKVAMDTEAVLSVDGCWTWKVGKTYWYFDPSQPRGLNVGTGTPGERTPGLHCKTIDEAVYYSYGDDAGYGRGLCEVKYGQPDFYRETDPAKQAPQAGDEGDPTASG
jgi:hypothetical protein